MVIYKTFVLSGCMNINSKSDILAQLFTSCLVCGSIILAPIMSVVPQAALAAKKVRQNEEKLKKGYNKSECLADLSPTNYSSKFMNSIWGMYNRYSVHNFKKNMDDGRNVNGVHGQQKESVGSNMSVEKSADFKGSRAVSNNFLGTPSYN